MTGALYVLRDTSRDTWELSDRATKLGLPARIAGPDFEGDRTTFNFGAAGAKMAISSSEGNGA